MLGAWGLKIPRPYIDLKKRGATQLPFISRC